MAYLRFSRDGRGYENTYVLHTAKKDGKTQPRMLYWFRTPPNVKVGRVSLDEEAIRAIEERNPGIVFDWKRMLQLRASLQADQRFGAEARGPKQRRRRTSRQTPPTPILAETQPVEVEPASEGRPQIPPLSEASDDDEAPAHDLLEAEVHLESDDAEEILDAPTEHPVVTLLGEETLARLRARHAEIRARISEKLSDLPALNEMLARAEVIDPDRWNTTETAIRGIERFESEAEAIRADLDRRPHRSQPVE